MKRVVIVLLLACTGGAAMARLGDRRLYPHTEPNYRFTASRDPNNWWDDVNDVYTINGTLEVLDANITGNLDVNDVNVTGDLILEGFTAGSVLFIGADANVVEDNASFFYTDSTNLLTIADLEVTRAGPAIVLVNGLDPSPRAIFEFEKNSVLKWDFGTTTIGSDDFIIREGGSATRFSISSTAHTLTAPSETDLILNFAGTTNSGVVTWMEDEDYFVFADDLVLSPLTASRLVSTDASKKLVSIADFTSWIAGTANEIDIADDGDGTITIGIVDPLIVGKGGTGAATLTDGGLLLGSGTGAITALGVATNGQIPIGDGATDPVLATLTGTAKRVTVTNGAGSITLSGPQDIDTVDSPTFVDLNLSGLLKLLDNGGIDFASASDSLRIDDTFDQLVLNLNPSTASGGQFIIGAWQATVRDYDHAPPTNPTIFGHSVIDPDTFNDQWWSITHDQTNAVFGLGSGAYTFPDGVIIVPGLTVTGSSVHALNSAIFQPTTDQTDFFKIMDADGGTPMFQMDTTNESAAFFGTPTINTDLQVNRTHSNAANPGVGGDFLWTQDTATAQALNGLRSAILTTHTSGTIGSAIGYKSVTQAQSNGAISSMTGMNGSVSVLDTFTPTITVMTGMVGGTIAVEDAAVTFALDITAPAVTKDTGSAVIAIGVYMSEQTVASSMNASWFAEGDCTIASNKKMNFEGVLGANGDTYIVYDSAGTTLDFFVNATEVMNANTTTVTVPVTTHLGGAANYGNIEPDGDVDFKGDSGLVFGSFYGNDIAFVVAGGTGTFSIVTDADIAVSQTNNTTFQNNQELDIGAYAGKCLVTWSMSVKGTGANKHLVGAIGVDVGGVTGDVAQNPGRNHAVTVGSTEVPLSGSTHLDLSANDEVSLMITNETDNTNVTVEHVNLTITQVGGT